MGKKGAVGSKGGESKWSRRREPRKGFSGTDGRPKQGGGDRSCMSGHRSLEGRDRNKKKKEKGPYVPFFRGFVGLVSAPSVCVQYVCTVPR